MSRPQSRVRREAAFLQEAQRMYEQLEDWYDAHPQASFGELETEARKRRRELMGKALAQLVNGRDVGVQVEAPKCEQCGEEMEFEGYRKWGLHGLEGDSELERAYYVCPHCEGQTVFPLDRKLKLRADHWSEGAARVATRHGLLGKSFELAAEAYSDATGGNMSKDSLRRITEGWGNVLEEKRQAEARQVYDANVPQLASQIVRVSQPIGSQANLSTDGGMVLLREEGWKEVKLSAISEVKPHLAASAPVEATSEIRLRLQRHSYQAGLWNADEMGQHQYLEGTRRHVEACRRVTSVNDGAPWIERITTTNYPKAIQIIDWGHAEERLWKVAKAAFGEGSVRSQQWAEKYIELLWHGRIPEVVCALQQLDWEKISGLEDIRQSPAYFESRQSKMDYARFRQAGYPIGSGTVESGINTVVHHRMIRQGRGWKRENAQAMLAALSEFHSRRFQTAWSASG